MTSLPQIIRSYWFVVIAFLLLVAPLALNFNFYYPDEVHYSDAAIQMLHNGDYLTPYQGNGEPRFNKPILTYWFVLIGFKLFGINAFAARFFFFISGAIILILVYQIGKLIYKEQKVALLASAITASNITLIMSSMRSIPDILLCLFVTLASLGFAGFIRFGNETPRKYKWMLFLGLALAFEAKGIPAIVFGATGLTFLKFNRWQPIQWKKLLHWPSIFSAIIMASSWSIVMLIRYGEMFSQSFYNDQLGERITINASTIIGNLGLSLILLLIITLPWITFISRATQALKPKTNYDLAFQYFVLIWIAATILLSGLVFKFYERYLLPVIPLGAVWISFLIIHSMNKHTRLIIFWGWIITLIHSAILLCAILLEIGLKSTGMTVYWLMLAIILTIIQTYIYFKRKTFKWLTISLLLIVFNVSLITRLISFPNEGTQLTQILKQEGIKTTAEIGFIGDPQIASKLRIESKGTYQLVNLYKLYAEFELENYETLIISEIYLQQFQKENFKILGRSLSWKSNESYALVKGIFNGNFSDNLEDLGKKYYILQRKTPLK